MGALIVAALLAQAASPAATGEAAQLQRIRKALADTPAVAVSEPADRDGLVFRVTVHAPPPGKPMWDDWSSVPSYIRPHMPLYHHEFLEQVTPEQFRASTLYPVGLPIGTLLELLGKHIRIAHRKTQEQRAKEEVRQALDALLACRADPSKPGC